LSGLRIPIRVQPADIIEDVLAGETPIAYLERIVSAKLAAVAARATDAEGHEPWAGSLVADTTVVLGDAILGKPRDVADAVALLTELCGRTHVVYTRYALALPAAPDRAVRARTVASRVTLRAASGDELQRYAATGEGLDKAGAYAVQGLGAFLVESIEGSYSNVVGLPACEVVLDLREVGLLNAFP
jgi:septum formation protein